MSSSSFLVRTATVVVALPLFFVLIFILPHYKHLVLNIAAVLVAAGGANEVETLLMKRGIPTFAFLFPLAGLIPAITYLEVLGIVSPRWSLAAPTALVVLVLLRSLWVRGRQDLAPLLQRISTSLLVLFYPALFLSFIVRLSALENASLVLFFFFSINFANDIMAYLVGMFIGRSTKLNYPISPNKSALGFAAGVVASIGIAVLFKALFPRLLPIRYLIAALFGAAVGAFTIAGDLVESALKRSAEVKDSGRIIPGRGGILDSIDSWLLTAPVFYFVFLIIS
jgi:phosphatidate cytidylyltransferase